MRSAAQRNQAADHRDDRREREHHRKQNQTRRSRRPKNTLAQEPREPRANEKSDRAAGNRQQHLFREKNPAHQSIARAYRLHHADFRAPLQHGGRGSSRNGERSSAQCRQRDNPQQRADARQNAALSFRYSPDRVDLSSRQHGSNLVAD